MRVVIHDQSLAAQLGDYTPALGSRSNFQPLWVNVSCRKYFVMIISHPHGKPKQVTVGETEMGYNKEILKFVIHPRILEIIPVSMTHQLAQGPAEHPL